MGNIKPIKTTQYGDVVIYHVAENIDLEVWVADETVWLSQAQMAMLFDVKENTVTYHIKEIYKIRELEMESTARKIRVVRQEGSRMVKRYIDYYNLDMILSIGYRVNTVSGIQFRHWASGILKDYMFRGYALNPHLVQLEQHVIRHDLQISDINQRIDNIVQAALPPKAGLFFNGETFDAYVFVADLIRSAKEDIKLVDNYIDDSVLLLLGKRQAEVSATIYTERITNQFQTDLSKYNTQYPPITIKEIEKVHDRFLIIDQQLYHFGASFKDLGKRLFVVSKIEEPALTEALMKVFS
ncbi:MAG: virulence RhuM family protein [Bacteroidales bacterium]|nr:virulence RhuM family protein [Bacteroidales bacterium]